MNEWIWSIEKKEKIEEKKKKKKMERRGGFLYASDDNEICSTSERKKLTLFLKEHRLSFAFTFNLSTRWIFKRNKHHRRSVLWR